MRIDVSTKGVDVTMRRIRQLDPAVNKARTDALKKVALFIEGEAKESVAGRRVEPSSVNTGRYLNSIFSKSDDVKAVIFTPLDYPQYLEYGTTKIRPRRHFQNTLRRNQQKVVDFLKADVQAEVKRV